MRFVPLPSISECANRIRSAASGVSALTSRCLQSIEAANETLHAIVTYDPERVMSDAVRLQQQLDQGGDLGPLHGIPIVVKDTIRVAGLPTGYGSRALSEPAGNRDATVVARLRAAGAIILGKATTWELGCGIGEFQTARGSPEALNPVDPAYFAGGSSNGCAVAVAAGFACAAIGGDTGGSIRSPAAACGVVGLKPTFGLIDRDGAFAHSSSLDHIGCFATDTAGTQIVFEAMAGLPHSELGEGDRHTGLRLGILSECFSAKHGPGPLVPHYCRFLPKLEAEGFALPALSTGNDPAVWREVMEIVGGYESYRQNRALLQLPDGDLSPSIRRWLTEAAGISTERYREALARREQLCGQLQRMFEFADLLLSPAALHPVPLNSDEEARQRYSVDSSLSMFNLTGHPAMSIPVGYDDNGMPVALQLTARRGDECLLARVGATLMRLAQSR